jgi:dTDP-4-dehydrorhamnose 3,5-epimerase
VGSKQRTTKGDVLNVENTPLERVKLIRLQGFEDHRGEYLELFNRKKYEKHGIDIDFVEDDISLSTRGVIKGIHGDDRTWKLITCLYGKFYLLVINYLENSPEYGKWTSFVLSDRNKLQVLVPPGFGNGHLCLSGQSIFHYKQSSYYNPDNQFTIRWNDPEFNFWWPVREPILSRRDEQGRFVE